MGKTAMDTLRRRIECEITSRGIKCSPQVANALYYAALLSEPENVGCSDSLLLGLFKSGSYTIDALSDAGVNTSYLNELADDSANGGFGRDKDVDPADMLFAPRGLLASSLADPSKEHGHIETSNLLEIAVSPESLEGSFADWFPKDLRSTSSPSTSFLQQVENQVCYVIDACIEVISKNPAITLKNRRKPITTAEKIKIIDELSDSIENTEIDWAISLANEWIINRRLILDNSDVTLRIISRLYDDLSFGASMFLESGGNFTALSASLQAAKRYAPERDHPLLGIVERDGRVYVKAFSYRSSARLDDDKCSSVLSIGAQIQLPITTCSLLSEFESIINSSAVKENEIQKFLEAYPVILQSLGYASCKPHVILKQPGQTDLIPDFILQRPGNNGFDILDLKLPDAKISVDNPYLRISHEIVKALAQLRAYKNFFNSPQNTSKFYKTYGFEPLSPELIVVIGRCSEFASAQDRVEISMQASGLRIITYDELIDYGRSRMIGVPRFG